MKGIERQNRRQARADKARLDKVAKCCEARIAAVVKFWILVKYIRSLRFRAPDAPESKASRGGISGLFNYCNLLLKHKQSGTPFLTRWIHISGGGGDSVGGGGRFWLSRGIRTCYVVSTKHALETRLYV